MSPTMDSSLSPSTFLHSTFHCDSKDDNVLNMSPITPSFHRLLNNSAAHLKKTGFSHQSKQSVDYLLPNESLASKSSIELMKEIATIEAEIVHMERHLLSLYRTAFPQELSVLLSLQNTPRQSQSQSQYIMESNTSKSEIDLHDQASRSYISKSFSRTESKSSCHRSLADHLGASRIDDTLNYPDKLSEQIVKCISSIYCRLANPSQTQRGFSVSSTSSTSSSSTFSPRNFSDFEESTRDSDFEGIKGEKGPYALMTQVLKLRLDNDSFKFAAITLQKFRSLVKGLEKVDPGKMKREEKLAFWINIHNALVMHAFLAYGTDNYVKNTSILKAAYNVGGQCINAYDIQYSILGSRKHDSAPWIQTFLSPGKKIMGGSTKHVYAIEYPEPHIHFALCSGAYCDPAVRVYTARNVFQDLKVAKEEFIQANVYIHKESKIYLPKILSYYAKDMSLDIAGLVEIVIKCLPEVQQKAMRTCLKGRPEKYVHWLSRNSTFRYLIHKEVSQGVY